MTADSLPLLHDIRVLDFGRYIAGPYCAAMLAEYGADVIRIEKRDGSEDRFPAQVGGGVGALFLQMNRNKRSMTLDPASVDGREIVARLVRSADVVIANLPDAALRAMGLDYETLRGYRRDIIVVTNTAFGTTGPMSHQVGFDGVGQVMSGAVYMTGQPDEPFRALVNWVDFGTATHCAFGTLAALMHRAKTGEGQLVTGALLATALAINNGALIEQAVARPDRIPTGNRSQISGPSDIYRTRDGFVLVSVVGQPLFKRWVRLMAMDERSGLARRCRCERSGLARRPALRDRRSAWQVRQRAHRAHAALVRDARSRRGRAHPRRGDDPLRPGTVTAAGARPSASRGTSLGLLQDTAYPGLPSPAPIAAVPLWMSETRPTLVERRRPPTIGEHTDAILIDLGFDLLRRDADRGPAGESRDLGRQVERCTLGFGHRWMVSSVMQRAASGTIHGHRAHALLHATSHSNGSRRASAPLSRRCPSIGPARSPARRRTA